MKKQFEWYFNPTKEEIDDAWKNGVLTVDTNVLLDLYRYHEGTRDSLIQSLQKFEGEKWLSYQAATEFFRNRTKVIVSSEKAFKQAQDEIDNLNGKLESAVARLKGNRIIPSEVSEKLDSAVKSSTSEAQSQINKAKESYPEFLQDDPILKQLSEIFNDAVGEDFKEESREEIAAQAEERRKNKVPPGYLDEGKDEDRPYGDYYLWRQIIEHAKAKERPVVLVTSERKEDWWEKISGKTTGPRPELLKEAKQISGQRILIYQTERFLEHALQRFQQPVNETAIEEIRAISTWRSELEVAVRLQEQSVTESTSDKNVGALRVELKRPVRNFTVSGHLNPNMGDVPHLTAHLISAPDSLPKHRINAGTGTKYDFNIHIICGEPGIHLPVGSYVFEYEATCKVPDSNVEASSALET
ncbi:hypothetical protein AGMMS50256_36840 [Betaproteobacteria bacterium]|nr:hypothetical protein AGMMS50256_36840 [Betaproteobacteria bacterium]